MTFELDLNTQPSLEEIDSFDAHIDTYNINICSDSSNSIIEPECATEVVDIFLIIFLMYSSVFFHQLFILNV
ncbi:hypothetical protein AHAS_Ahas11G0165300 [Arachis hypogaea]